MYVCIYLFDRSLGHGVISDIDEEYQYDCLLVIG